MRSHPHLRTTRPVPTTALGLRGVRLDFALYPEDSKARFLVLDQDGRQLIIDEWVQPRRRFERVVRDLHRELRAIRLSP